MATKDRKVRVLVGTRKGGYVVESDTKRRKWAVKGPFHEGGDVYHLVADPRSPGDLYAAVNNGYFGPRLFRSANWGKNWKELAPPMMPVLSKRGPPTGDPVEQAKRPIINLWHIEPGPASEPGTVFLGIDPASLFRSDDKGRSWTAVPGLNEHETRPTWNPGAGGMCLHSILIDPTNPRRMYVGISAAGVFRTDDGGDHWKPLNRGVRVSFLPEKEPVVGQCVHKIAFEPSDPNTLYRQDHDGIYVSHDSAEKWTRVGRPLPSDFGFVVTAPPARPREAYFVPLEGRARTTPGGALQIYRWQDTSREWTPMIKGRPFVGELGTHREGLASDHLDPPGIYLGTTTGQLVYSADAGKRWAEVPYRFPGIHSVAVSSPISM